MAEPRLQVHTLVGQSEGGYCDGQGDEVLFSYPMGLTVNRSNTLFVADNHRIRSVTTEGKVDLVAGLGTFGYVDGEGAGFNTIEHKDCFFGQNAHEMEVASEDDIAACIRLCHVKGWQVFVVIKDPKEGDTAFFKNQSPDECRAVLMKKTPGTVYYSKAKAMFYDPSGLAVDSEDNVIVADRINNCVRSISPEGSVKTLAGSRRGGFDDGKGGSATFLHPADVAVIDGVDVIVADRSNHRIRKISTQIWDKYEDKNVPRDVALVTTLAGTGEPEFRDAEDGIDAGFNCPSGLVVDEEGNVIVADQMNHRIRKITREGTVSTFAGSGDADFADGEGSEASFNQPTGLALDSKGNLIVADRLNNRIRKISPEGIVTTLAGCGEADYEDGSSKKACFFHPYGVAVLVGDTGEDIIAVTDSSNRRIRLIKRREKKKKERRPSTDAGGSSRSASEAEESEATTPSSRRSSQSSGSEKSNRSEKSEKSR